jgi:hypothetical protein
LNNTTNSQIEKHGTESKEVAHEETKTHIGQAAEVASEGDIIIDTVKTGANTGDFNLKGSNIVVNNNIEINIQGDLRGDIDINSTEIDANQSTDDINLASGNDINSVLSNIMNNFFDNQSQDFSKIYSYQEDLGELVEMSINVKVKVGSMVNDFDNLLENLVTTVEDTGNVLLVVPIWWNEYIYKHIDYRGKQCEKK